MNLKNPVILYHGECPDGFGAAYCAWRKFGDTAEYIPVTYGEAIPDVTGKDVLIFDFCYSKEILEDMKSKATSLEVHDHHKSAMKELNGELDYVFFDMNRSGAMLAWDYFNPGEDAPNLIKHIQDMDLWNWNIPESRAFTQYFLTLPFDFKIWDGVANMSVQEYMDFIQVGEAYKKYFEWQCNEIASKAIPVVVEGYEVYAVNAPSMFASDVGNVLAIKHQKIAFVFSVRNGNFVNVSLRSIGDLDVIPLAKKFDGGGHSNASGCKVSFEKLKSILSGQPVNFPFIL